MSQHEVAPTAGVVQGMPSAAYHAIHALSATGLKRLARSPQHFYRLTLDPARPPDEPTRAMELGTLLHCALLEPNELSARYRVRPPGIDGRTKTGKAWLDEHAAFEIVTAEEMATSVAQALSVRALPEIGPLLERGRAEQSAFWTDQQTGAPCKCRPDFASPAGDGGVVIVDLKTCVDASAEGFARAVTRYGYDLQDVHYSEGFERASGAPVVGFVLACVESAYPYAAASYMLEEDWLDQARTERRRLIELYAACTATGSWPGYQQSIQLLTMPRWLRVKP